MMSELPKASSSSRPARHPCACPPRLHGHHRKNHLLVVFSRVSLSASALGLPVIRVSSVLCFSTTAALACNCSNCCRISRPLDPTSFVPCFPSSSNATDYCAHVRLQPHLEHFFLLHMYTKKNGTMPPLLLRPPAVRCLCTASIPTLLRRPPSHFLKKNQQRYAFVGPWTQRNTLATRHPKSQLQA